MKTKFLLILMLAVIVLTALPACQTTEERYVTTTTTEGTGGLAPVAGGPNGAGTTGTVTRTVRAWEY